MVSGGDYVTQTIAVYNAIAKAYTQNTKDSAPVIERARFVSLLPKNGRVLDAGCGPGRDSKFFADQGFDTTGVDLSEKFLEIAQSSAPYIRFEKQDLRQLHFSLESFDGIWACASLLHLKREEVPAVLMTFFSLLKSNGVLSVKVKQGHGEACISDEYSQGKKRNFVYFMQKELKKLLEEAGFMGVTVTVSPGRNHKNKFWLNSFSRKSVDRL